MRGKIRDGRGFLCWQPIEKHRMLAFRMVICEPVLLRQRDDCGLRHWDLHEHTPPVGCANFGHDACKFLFQGFHARNGPCTNLDGRTSKAALAPADEGGGGATEAADATNCTHRNCHCYYGCVGVCMLDRQSGQAAGLRVANVRLGLRMLRRKKNSHAWLSQQRLCGYRLSSR